MIKIKVNPGGNILETPNGVSIRDTLITAGFDIYSPCGGIGVCGKCKVHLIKGEVEGDVDEDGNFLSCRTFPLTDCEIVVTLIESKPSADEIQCDPLQSGAETGSYGIAVDLGTTGVVAALMCIETGDIVGVQSANNPQAKYGEDIITRITIATEPDGLLKLQNEIIKCVDKLVLDLCGDFGISTEQVKEIVVSGNATMNHLLMGVSPEKLGQAPYEPVFKSAGSIPGPEFYSIKNTTLTLLPNIAGFVGGDTVSGIIATDQHKSEKLILFIDIGTNGEIVIGNKDRIIATSAAAGPAFEGGRIDCGMRADIGAINHVTIDNSKISYTTIGGGKARGICGSGLFEAVGSMLGNNLIDNSGKFTRTQSDKRFILSQEDGIYISEKDISELQLAKAAIRSGVEVLLSRYEVSIDEIDRIMLAGAFGYNLRVGDIRRIGLLPDFNENKLRFEGNTSLKGALEVLREPENRMVMIRISEKVEFVELAMDSDFRGRYVESLRFDG